MPGYLKCNFFYISIYQFAPEELNKGIIILFAFIGAYIWHMSAACRAMMKVLMYLYLGVLIFVNDIGEGLLLALNAGIFTVLIDIWQIFTCSMHCWSVEGVDIW